MNSNEGRRDPGPRTSGAIAVLVALGALLASIAQADERCGEGRRWNPTERRCIRSTAPRAPRSAACPAGEHRTQGHCCAPGRAWVEAQQSCVCFDEAACGSSSAASDSEASPCPGGMSFVPGGTFMMGSETMTYDRAHRVTVSPYCIHTTEVTVRDYERCAASAVCPSDRPTHETCNTSARGLGDHPINCVSWYDARTYCEAIGARLPTDAQWEFAARGTDGRPYPWGWEAPDGTRANFCSIAFVTDFNARYPDTPVPVPASDDPFERTAPVGSFPEGASPWGVLDLLGNVAEWVEDRSGPYSGRAQTDPTGPRTGRQRGMRGRGYDEWSYPADFRTSGGPTYNEGALGFRCVRSVRP